VLQRFVSGTTGHKPRIAKSTPLPVSRLQHISHILQVPVTFFFEAAPHQPGQPKELGDTPSPAYVSDFLATHDGLALTKAFMRIKEPKLRRGIVNLVREIAGDE
jgi:hypothetical protein